MVRRFIFTSFVLLFGLFTVALPSYAERSLSDGKDHHESVKVGVLRFNKIDIEVTTPTQGTLSMKRSWNGDQRQWYHR